MGLQRTAGPLAITPRLLLNEAQMSRNIARMNRRLLSQGVSMRPHVKTAKSLPIIDRMLAEQPNTKVTVSTLAEASHCVDAGIKDILYAVGIVPNKMAAVQALNRRGGQCAVLLDSVVMARALAAACSANATAPSGDGSVGQASLRVYIELDVDQHRAGVVPAGAELIEIAHRLRGAPHLQFAGVMTHAGASYECRSTDELVAMAERERAGAVLARDRLVEQNIACPEVSVGSTPTAVYARSLAGVTEVRVGVYVFQDLTMMGLGVCDRDELALSVMTTVIGHQSKRNCLLVDAGWMALSSDRSTAKQARDMGYGLVTDDLGGRIQADQLIVSGVNQEHGLVTRRDGAAFDLSEFPIGTNLRVFPNHACATAAAFPDYDVECADGGSARWARFGGWA